MLLIVVGLLVVIWLLSVIKKRVKINDYLNNSSTPVMPASEFFDLNTLKRRLADMGPIVIGAQNAVEDKNRDLTEEDLLILAKYNESVYDFYWQTSDFIQHWGRKLYSKEDIDEHIQAHKDYIECEKSLTYKANQHLNDHIRNFYEFIKTNPNWLTGDK